MICDIDEVLNGSAKVRQKRRLQEELQDTNRAVSIRQTPFVTLKDELYQLHELTDNEQGFQPFKLLEVFQRRNRTTKAYERSHDVSASTSTITPKMWFIRVFVFKSYAKLNGNL